MPERPDRPREGAPSGAEVERVLEAYDRRDPRLRERYSCFDPAFLAMAQERERAVLRLLVREGFRDLSARRILEVGTGEGRWLRDLIRWGASPGSLVGADLRASALAEARRLTAPGVRLVRADGRVLPFADASFDLVVQSTLFTSILNGDHRRAVAAELARVLSPGGLVVWYDFRVDNPLNPDVRGVGRREIRTLFPGCAVRCRSLTLAPPLARRIAPRARWLVGVLSAVGPLRTHLLAAIRKGGAAG